MYDCTFDMDTLQYHLVMNLVDEDGNQIDTEELLDDCFWGLFAAIVAAIVVVYHVVTETAEQVKAKKNYSYNRDLEKKGLGVNSGYYIYNQGETTKQGYKSGNYRFGFTTFKGVGCEVATVYNARIKLNKIERLSETINKFEKWAIEFSSGWGYLGSDPSDLYVYFNRDGIKYTKYKYRKCIKH